MDGIEFTNTLPETRLSFTEIVRQNLLSRLLQRQFANTLKHNQKLKVWFMKINVILLWISEQYFKEF